MAITKTEYLPTPEAWCDGLKGQVSEVLDRIRALVPPGMKAEDIYFQLTADDDELSLYLSYERPFTAAERQEQMAHERRMARQHRIKKDNLMIALNYLADPDQLPASVRETMMAMDRVQVDLTDDEVQALPMTNALAADKEAVEIMAYRREAELLEKAWWLEKPFAEPESIRCRYS